MADAYHILPVEGTNAGKKIRTRSRTVGGNDVHEQYVIQQDEKIVTYHGRSVSFVTPGRAATGQTLFTIENATDSTILVDLTRLMIQADSTTALTSRSITFTLGRGTAPTNGTTLTKTCPDSTLSSDTKVIIKGDASADGTSSASALSYTPGVLFRKQYGHRLHTLVGQVIPVEIGLVNEGDRDYTLNPNECFTANIVAAGAGDNPVTEMYLVNVSWDEYTLP